MLGAGSGGGWPGVLDPGGRGWPAVLAVPLLLLAGAGHAAGYTPLFTRVLSWVEPRYAATLSGTGLTGTLLASVFGVAAVGGVYLAVVDAVSPAVADSPGRSAAGLTAVTAIVIGLLLVGAACAHRVRSVRRR